jgi:hypothetical protein
MIGRVLLHDDNGDHLVMLPLPIEYPATPDAIVACYLVRIRISPLIGAQRELTLTRPFVPAHGPLLRLDRIADELQRLRELVRADAPVPDSAIEILDISLVTFARMTDTGMTGE